MSDDEKERCEAMVWHRDTYRYTGRTKNGFEMHYDKKQCKRHAQKDGLCWQHGKLAEMGCVVFRCSWAKP